MKMESLTLQTPPPAKWERITPFLASEMLRRNPRNRAPRQRRVYALAEAMRRGAFRANGETIKFGANDELIDGQHRLLAIVMSGVEQTILVVRDLNRDEVFDTIDTGAARTGGDVLRADGDKYGNIMAAGLKVIVLIEDYDSPLFTRVIAHDQLRHKLKSYPGIRHWAQVQGNSEQWRKLALSGSCGVLAMFEEAGADRATLQDFVDGAKTGIDLKEGDPRLVFRDRMSIKKRGVRMQPDMYYALLIKSMNAWVNGRKLSVLRWQSTEDFPSIGA